MKADTRILFEELLHRLGLVRRHCVAQRPHVARGKEPSDRGIEGTVGRKEGSGKCTRREWASSNRQDACFTQEDLYCGGP